MPVTTVFPNGFGQIHYQFLLSGDPDPITVGLAFEVSVPPFVGANATAISDSFASIWGSLGNSAYSFEGVEILIAQPTGDPLQFFTSDPTPGGQTALPLPQNTTYLFKKTSSLAGRRNRGRMYIPGVPEGEVNQTGVITPGHRTIMQQLGTNLASIPADPAANVLRLVILHSYEWSGEVDPGPPSGFPEPTTVGTILLDAVVATQRRRLR